MADAKKVSEGAETSAQADDARLGRCGIIMPISKIEDCDENHWLEVKAIISRAAKSAGFVAELVSSDTDSGVIQKRIVQNIYECPVVVCDVSCKNPNVMLELGMRLAFDKPVVLIKDHSTTFSFDTSPLEHLVYPRGLRFAAMEDFMSQLSAKIKKSAATSGANSFLKSFGTFQTAQIDVESAPADQLMLSELSELKALVTQAIAAPRSAAARQAASSSMTYDKVVQVGPTSYKIRLLAKDADDVLNFLSARGDLLVEDVESRGPDQILSFRVPSSARRSGVIEEIQKKLDDIIPF